MTDNPTADLLALVALMVAAFLFGAMIVGIVWWLT